MKHTLSLFTFFMFLAAWAVLTAQAPQAINYQAVARNASGQTLNSMTLGVQVTLHQGTPTGTVVYQETFMPSTSSLGLYTLKIGQGTPVQGSFAAIDWSQGPYFTEMGLDDTGGTNYVSMGTAELLSVPYALHAETVTFADDADADPNNELQSLQYDSTNQVLTISGGNAVNLSALNGAPGPVGPAGATGATGPAGATGAIGPQGLTGPIGPQGPAGPIGNTGAIGPQGPAGPVGNTGAIGPQGPAGPVGNTGAIGPQGLAGPTGNIGPIGPQGPAGPQGPVGPAGPAGPISAPGYHGTGLVTFYAERFPEEEGNRWYHNSVVMENGEVKMWGHNTEGSMGIGNMVNTDVKLPRLTPLPDSVISMISNGKTTYFTMKDRTLWAAGANQYGQAGVGSTNTYVLVPEQVVNVSGVKKVVVSKSNTFTTKAESACALLDNGQVWCWGYNPFGQLGNGTLGDSNIPVRAGLAINMQDATDIDMGGRNWGSACAVRSDTSLWCWGRNSYGQLGTGNTIDQPAPVPVHTSSDSIVKVLSQGDSDFCSRFMLKSDGTVWAWGSNSYGQLGKGSTAASYLPGQVQGLSNVVDLFVGGGFQVTVVALLADSTIRTWGANGRGQCGIGNTTHQYLPVDPGLTGVKSISIAGDGQANIGSQVHTVYALKHDGTIWGMGHNGSGQIGDGYTVDRHIPTKVVGISNAVALNASGYVGATTCSAILEDGRVKCWGYNSNGQTGTGDTSPILVPSLVKDLNE